MTTKPPRPTRVSVHGVGWKKPISIPAERFEQVAEAISAALTTEPIRFTELTDRVAKRLPGFEGSIPWHTVSVARELEVQGRLIRQVKPALYSKPAQTGGPGTSTRPSRGKAVAQPGRARGGR